MLISIERDDWTEQCELKTMKILMDKTLLFWVDVAYEHIKSANSQPLTEPGDKRRERIGGRCAEEPDHRQPSRVMNSRRLK
jgi:hypothetical protein